MSLGTRFSLRARVTRHPPRRREENPPQLRALHRAHLDRLLASHDGPRAPRLLSLLQTMTLVDGAALLAHLRLDGWPEADHGARQAALTIINRRVVALRERANLLPFDDPIPFSDAPANVFLKLRELLGEP